MFIPTEKGPISNGGVEDAVCFGLSIGIIAVLVVVAVVVTIFLPEIIAEAIAGLE